jgi:hypothetical protein
MAKPIRYKDGTMMMPGSGGYELATLKKTKELDKHMADLDKAWRKLEGRKPVAELSEREQMFEGRIPWNPALLQVAA